MLDYCNSDHDYQLYQSDGNLTNIDSTIVDWMEWQAVYHKNKSGYIKIADDLSVFYMQLNTIMRKPTYVTPSLGPAY